MGVYTPGPAPGNADDWVRRELDKVAQASRAASPYIQLQPLAVEPDRPRAGMMVYADPWNPGAGVGLYAYSGSAWVKL